MRAAEETPFPGRRLSRREVLRAGLAVAAWWLRGRFRVPLDSARATFRAVTTDPVALLFVAGLCVVLGYELMLCLFVAPNNWDSLAYHLSRAAAWKQYGGIHWIQHAPTGRSHDVADDEQVHREASVA